MTDPATALVRYLATLLTRNDWQPRDRQRAAAGFRAGWEARGESERMEQLALEEKNE